MVVGGQSSYIIVVILMLLGDNRGAPSGWRIMHSIKVVCLSYAKVNICHQHDRHSTSRVSNPQPFDCLLNMLSITPPRLYKIINTNILKHIS